MAYVELTLKDWLVANPEYNKFPGTVSGKPLIYQTAAGEPSLKAEDWIVWDYITEFPDLAQSPASADISPSGAVNRKLINTVPDAPSPSDLQVFLGEDTDATMDAIDGIVEANKTAIESNEKFYLGNFMGVGKRSEIYAASIAWTSGILGTFPDPVTTNVSVTPNLGEYHSKKAIITDI